MVTKNLIPVDAGWRILQILVLLGCLELLFGDGCSLFVLLLACGKERVQFSSAVLLALEEFVKRLDFLLVLLMGEHLTRIGIDNEFALAHGAFYGQRPYSHKAS